MKKNKAKDGIVVNAGNGNYIPNIVRGGAAIPIGKKNFYYMQGRKHEQGGIDVGRNPKTGLEVEGEEVMQVTPNEVRVYSSVPFLRGVSPAELVLNGADANKVFAAQEKYKDNNRINDDGTKYRTGGNVYNRNAKIAVSDNTNINRPIMFDTVERVVSSSDKLDVPVGTKYSELSSKQKIQLLSSDKLNKDKEGLKIVSPEFDILTGIRGLINTGYKLTLPKDTDRYYRIVGKSSDKSKDAIADAIESGVIRTKRKDKTITLANGKTVQLGKQFDYPMFSKGQPWKGSNAAGTKNVNYIVSKKGNSPIKWEESNIDFNHKNHAGIFRPNYNGNLNSTPAEYFEYYKSLPFNLGYIKGNFKYGGNKKPLGGNLPTNQNDFLDTWNASRLATGRYNNQLGDGRLERQAESRNTAREFHSPIGFAMNYGKRAAIRTPSMSDTDYRKEIARNAQSMKIRLNTPETGQGVIGGAYHAPTHSSYINQEEFAKDPTVRTHENAHASKAVEQEQIISNIIGSNNKSDYLRRPTEIYSRLMQFRQANNIDPNTVYDKNSFKELKKNAIDYNLINTFKDEEVIDLLNNVAMSNDPNKINLNNYNLNNVPAYMAKYGTKQKCKMGKLVSINGNVKNGLIHTPNQDVLAYNKERKPRFNGRYSKPGLHNLELLAADLILPKGKVNIEPDVPKRLGWVEAHNRLVGADISQKPLDAKKDNTNVAHTISETERRTRKFQNGGSATYKGKQLYQLPFDPDGLYYQQVDEFGDVGYIKVEDGEWIKENNPSKQSTTAKRNHINIDSIANAKRKDVADFLINTFNLKPRNYVDGVTGAARRVPTVSQTNSRLTRNVNKESDYFIGPPEANYDNKNSITDLQKLFNLTPRKGSNQSSSSSTGDVNSRTTKSTKSTKSAVQRVNKLAPATNAEMAGIRRGLEPLLQNTIVNKLNKTVDNDLNVMPVQDDIAKTRNIDNILLGVNLGSSVLDAVMGNIYANQMHGYTAPNITTPTIENPGEIKLNEEDLKDIPAPILMAAAKLKTRYNANPQLSKIEDDTRRIMGEIGRNTSNSRVALARKQRAALQGQQAKNEVYGRKENIETELINKDKLNQQEVTARNLARYDQYNQALAAQRANRARLRLAADTANIQNKLAVSTANAQLKSQADRFNTTNRINQLVHQAGIDAAKAEARSSIFSGMLGNIGSALNTWNRNKRQAKLDEETLRVLGLRAPNANKLVLSALGY